MKPFLPVFLPILFKSAFSDKPACTGDENITSYELASCLLDAKYYDPSFPPSDNYDEIDIAVNIARLTIDSVDERQQILHAPLLLNLQYYDKR